MTTETMTMTMECDMITIEFSRNIDRLLSEQVRATVTAFKDGVVEREGCGCSEESPSGKFVCTRDRLHDGLHIASGGTQAVALWEA